MKSVVRSVTRYFKDTDKILWALFLGAALLGIIIQLGISHTFYDSYRKILIQGIALAIGIIAAIVISLIDYTFLGRMWKIHLPIAIFLVLLTFVIGTGREGIDDIAWIMLPGGASIQPAEFLKISFIVSFSYHLSKVGDDLNSIPNIIALCVHGALPIVLVHFQGDDGTALVFAFMVAIMLFAAGLSWKYWAAAGGAIAVAAPLIWIFILDNDKKMRILSIFNPGIDPQGIEYQQLGGLTSIGSGQLLGKGIFSGNHRYVAEIQNDFVIAFIGEAMGFIGAIIVIGLLLGIMLRSLRVATFSKDSLGSFICIGVFANLCVQTIINLGMCLRILPVIGVTLPFFSLGGSSIISIVAEMGLVLSVYMHNKTFLFE